MQFDKKIDICRTYADIMDDTDAHTIIDNAVRYHNNGQNRQAHRMLDKIIKGGV